MIICSKKNVVGFALFSATALALIVGAKFSYTHGVQKLPLIPLRDFFKNPERTNYKLSPDGTCLSFLASYQNRLNIFVQKIGTDFAEPITSIVHRDIREYFWKNNEMLMYLMDNNGDENFHLFGVSKDGSILKDFTSFQGVKVGIVDCLEDDAANILIKMNCRDKKVFEVYRLNIQTGALVEIAQNPGNIIGWLTDHEGKLRVEVRLEGAIQTVLCRETESVPFQPILTTDYKDNAWPFLFTFDNKQLYLFSNINRDKKSVVLFDPITKQEAGLIYAHPEFDITGVKFSRNRKVLTYVEYVSWHGERAYLDAQAKKLFTYLEQAFPGYEIGVHDQSKNEDKVILRIANDRTLGSYYLYEITADRLTKLADIAPWLKEGQLAHVQPISYAARDGLTIHGYLTVPLGRDPQKLPVVIHPHGGPRERDTWRFNPEVQFFADRGYAVLQMNFRGSTGYGKKFLALSYKQWGRTMQDDITDGVTWLIERGIADPKRIAIYGGSYGGYATLVGLAFTPDLYACGIDYCGITNLFTFFDTFPEYWEPMLSIWLDRIGNPEKDKELLMQISPLFHVDKIKVPVFIAQGRMDPRVPIAESDQMVVALKKRGIEVEYMVKDNEGHGFAHEENKFDYYEAMERFLAKHLKQ